MTLTVTQTTEDFNNNQCDQTLSRTSKCSEHSIDLLKRMNLRQDSGDVAETMKTERHGDNMVWNHKCSKHSTSLRNVLTTSHNEVQSSPPQQEGLQDGTPPAACGGDCHEPSTHLTQYVKSIGNNVSVSKFSWLKSMSQIVGLTAAWHQDKVE